MFDRRRSFLFAAALALSMLASSLLAQEDAPPPAGRGAQGGRGGRGGRGGGGRGNTREFLGLGPAPDEAAAKKGEPLYKQNCSTCHGETARGAQGPNLVRSVLVLHDEKGEEIGPVIKNGRPQGGMPGFASLSQDDLYNISQYLHLQVELAANRGTYGATYGALRNEVSGDAGKGEQFFKGAGGCGQLPFRYRRPGEDRREVSTGLGPAIPLLMAGHAGPGQGDRHPGFRRNDYRNGPHHERLRSFPSPTPAGSYHQWPRDQVKVEIEDRLSGHRALLPKYTRCGYP